MFDGLDQLDDGSQEGGGESLFPCRLTARTTTAAGVHHYSGAEQTFSPATGAYSDAPSPRRFDPNNLPRLVELNNRAVAVPCYAWVRLRGRVGGPPYYEFCAGSAWGGAASAALTADQDDYAPDAGASTLYLDVTGDVTVTGLSLEESQLLTVVNVGTGTLTFTSEDVSSLSQNRVTIPGGGDSVTLETGDSATFVRNTTNVTTVSTTAKIDRPVQAVTITTDTDDQPTASNVTQIVVTNNTSLLQLTGLSGGRAGRQLTVTNSKDSTYPVELPHLDTSSVARNRIDTVTTSKIPLGPGDSALLTWGKDGAAGWVADRPRASYPHLPTLTTDQDDYPLLGGVLVPTLAGPVTVTGFDARRFPAGTPFAVLNPRANSDDLTLAHEDAGSSATNRMSFSTGADVVLGPGESAWLVHDGDRVVDLGGSLALAAAAAPSPFDEATVAAAGSTQGDAAALTAAACDVTGADGTKGVLLRDAAGPQVVRNASLSPLKVYPPGGGQINGLGANAPYGVSGLSVVFWRTAAGQWNTLPLSS